MLSPLALLLCSSSLFSCLPFYISGILPLFFTPPVSLPHSIFSLTTPITPPPLPSVRTFIPHSLSRLLPLLSFPSSFLAGISPLLSLYYLLSPLFSLPFQAPSPHVFLPSLRSVPYKISMKWFFHSSSFISLSIPSLLLPYLFMYFHASCSVLIFFIFSISSSPCLSFLCLHHCLNAFLSSVNVSLLHFPFINFTIFLLISLFLSFLSLLYHALSSMSHFLIFTFLFGTALFIFSLTSAHFLYISSTLLPLQVQSLHSSRYLSTFSFVHSLFSFISSFFPLFLSNSGPSISFSYFHVDYLLCRFLVAYHIIY